MIPKIIHHVWVGEHPMPQNEKDNVEKWKELNPDYEFKFWTKNEFCYNAFTKYCEENNRWNYYIDWLKTNILYKEGGVYIDTDVVPLKPIPVDILNYEFSIAKVKPFWIGSWFMAAVKGSKPLELMIETYNTDFREVENIDLVKIQDGIIFKKHLIKAYGEEELFQDGNMRFSFNDYIESLKSLYMNKEYSNVLFLEKDIRTGMSNPDQKVNFPKLYNEGGEKVHLISPAKALQWSNDKLVHNYLEDYAFCIHTKDPNYMKNLQKLSC